MTANFNESSFDFLRTAWPENETLDSIFEIRNKMVRTKMFSISSMPVNCFKNLHQQLWGAIRYQWTLRKQHPKTPYLKTSYCSGKAKDQSAFNHTLSERKYGSYEWIMYYRKKQAQMLWHCTCIEWSLTVKCQETTYIDARLQSTISTSAVFSLNWRESHYFLYV